MKIKILDPNLEIKPPPGEKMEPLGDKTFEVSNSFGKKLIEASYAQEVVEP
jgi:hypothetical protein